MNTASVYAGKILMGLSKPQKGYNGNVQVGQQQVPVTQGVAVVQGKKFYVSDKGQVTDDFGSMLGTVQNGQFVQNTSGQQGGQQ